MPLWNKQETNGGGQAVPVPDAVGSTHRCSVGIHTVPTLQQPTALSLMIFTRLLGQQILSLLFAEFSGVTQMVVQHRSVSSGLPVAASCHLQTLSCKQGNNCWCEYWLGIWMFIYVEVKTQNQHCCADDVTQRLVSKV